MKTFNTKFTLGLTDSSNYRSILTIEIRETTSCDRHRYSLLSVKSCAMGTHMHVERSKVETVLNDVTKFLSVMPRQTPLCITNPQQVYQKGELKLMPQTK